MSSLPIRPVQLLPRPATRGRWVEALAREAAAAAWCHTSREMRERAEARRDRRALYGWEFDGREATLVIHARRDAAAEISSIWLESLDDAPPTAQQRAACEQAFASVLDDCGSIWLDVTSRLA